MIAFSHVGVGVAATVNPTCAITINPGDTVIVGIHTNAGTAVGAVHDNGASGGNTYTKMGATGQITSNLWTELWVSTATKAATTITATVSTSLFGIVIAATYTGVISFGNVAAPAGNTFSTSATISLATQDVNNFIVAVFGGEKDGVGVSTSVWSNLTGNLRGSSANPTSSHGVGGAIADNTAASATTVTVAESLDAQNDWNACAIELRSVPPTKSDSHSGDLFASSVTTLGVSGAALVCFGPITAPSASASVAVTGQSGILPSSKVEAWIRLADSPDHSTDEHLVENLKITAGNIVSGVGFTINAEAFPVSWGCWNVFWAWA